MKYFGDTNELILFAKSFLEERVDSLEKDVVHCLRSPYAPFPALLYCFSTVDLLGALYGGNAKRRRDSTAYSKSYMERFMYYSKEQASLLIDIFRHKVVHLAQPNPVFRHNGKDISWAYWHDDRSHHLKLISLDPPVKHSVSSGVTVNISHRFEISIVHFVKDIRDSVFEPGGYFHTLKQEGDLQTRFETAVSDIYDPTQ